MQVLSRAYVCLFPLLKQTHPVEYTNCSPRLLVFLNQYSD